MFWKTGHVGNFIFDLVPVLCIQSLKSDQTAEKHLKICVSKKNTFFKVDSSLP
jgi:hypothetical protein